MCTTYLNGQIGEHYFPLLSCGLDTNFLQVARGILVLTRAARLAGDGTTLGGGDLLQRNVYFLP
jgi:hypothetical protein